MGTVGRVPGGGGALDGARSTLEQYVGTSSRHSPAVGQIGDKSAPGGTVLTLLRRIPAMKTSPATTASSRRRLRATSSDFDARGHAGEGWRTAARSAATYVQAGQPDTTE